MSDTLQISIPVINILIDGQSDPLLEEDVELCVIDTTFSLPSMATIRFYDPAGTKSRDPAFKIGATLALKLGPSKAMQAVEAAQVFVGEIVALEPAFNTIGTGTLTIRAYDRSHRLHYGTKSRTFTEMKESDIVQKIAKDCGVDVDSAKIFSGGAQHKYLVQSNVSDFEFLMTRAKRTGCIFGVINGKFCFDLPEKIFSDGPLLTMKKNLRQFSVRRSAALQPTQIEVRGWDITQKQVVKATEDPKELWNINGFASSGAASAKELLSLKGTNNNNLITFTPQTTEEATALAKSAAGDQEGVFFEADAVCYGHPGLVAGVKVDIEELNDKYNGKYFVTSATHIYNSGGYEVHAAISGRYPQTINQLLSGNPSTPIEPGSYHGVVIGIVTNNKDPDNLGRVKVKFPWMVGYTGEIESNWARVAAIGAGPNRGMYYIPEMEDEVLVIFEHGNPNRPYVIGGLWNGKDLPPEKSEVAARSGIVNHRMIVSRSGHKIVLDDENQKESILIMDKSQQQSLLMESKGDITLKGQGNLLIEMQGNVTIKSNMTIEMQATADIKMKGVNLSAEASGMYKVDAKTELEMKSNGFASFESTTATAVKGPTLDIEASAGPASIQGKPIMLN